MWHALCLIAVNRVLSRFYGAKQTDEPVKNKRLGFQLDFVQIAARNCSD